MLFPSTRETKHVVTVGFAIVSILMAILMYLGVRTVERNEDRLNAVVHNNNLKTELISEMRQAARERTICLYKMLVMEDPFAQDGEWMQFNVLGARFVAAKEKLLALPMSETEMQLIDLQRETSAHTAPAQRDVARLIIAGDKPAARKMLLETTIPSQERAFAVLAQITQYQKDTARQAVDNARAEFNKTLTQMLMLGAGFTIFIIFIARLVRRQAMESEQRLFNAKEHAQITLHSIGEGVICTNEQGDVEELNEAAAHLIGREVQESLGHPVSKIMSMTLENNPEKSLDPVARVLARGGLVTSDGNAILHRPDDSELAVEYTASPIYNANRHLVGSILVFRDVTQMRSLSNQLAYHARHDALTGLLNRREFEQRVEEALQDAHAHHRESWLCFIDMDQFKLINDTCGHLAGDELLKRVGSLLSEHIRDTDMVARMGGDEFAILVHRCDQGCAERLLERVRHELHELRFAWDGKTFNTSGSMGLVPINHQCSNLHELLSTADSACYLAKESGRNRIHTHQPDDAAMAKRDGEMQWVHRINDALDEDRFTLFYQAIAPLSGDPSSRCGEVLVRMIAPNGDLVPPMAFIPAAERYDLMSQIDRWVVAHTINHLERCATNIFGDNGWISINLSTQSLCDDDFLAYVLDLLDRHSIEPSLLCFEITETCAIANLARAMEFIHTLRRRGCRFALDDFGSGVSSFAYLKNLPVDLLKMDGAFVRDICDNEINKALIEAINRIGHVMGMKTVAEYVEDLETVRALQDIGVDYGQGFGIHKPAPLAQTLFDNVIPRRETA